MKPLHGIGFNSYTNYYIASVILAALLRLTESFHVYVRFNPPHLFTSEVYGFLSDLVLCGLVLLFFYPLHRPLLKRWPRFGYTLGWYVIGLFVILHITISEYFYYQLRPLDIFFFKHTAQEMAFSISTADTNVFWPALLKYSFLSLSCFGLSVLLYPLWLSDPLKKAIFYSFIIYSGLFLSVSAYVKFPVTTNLAVNKSGFLYGNILKEVARLAFGPDLRTKALQFQQEVPGREYLDVNYPFLHRFQPRNVLGPYLNPTTRSPHIVLIIVEGLGEDFVHPSHGMTFMPFLDSLANKGLHWNHFLSTSERSFGATPSINGSLPFGTAGFALQEQYPYHFSLVNVLKKNGYQTRFFYGQGAWFHGKEPFYRFNNIDTIIDKERYDPSLEKVYVGKEKHFWGYNDFDLFRQYFLSTDFQNPKLRYDVFFTGTSHAPFALKYPKMYQQRYNESVRNVQDPQWRWHFETYRKYYSSLYNVDEALRYFFETYAHYDEFKNTLFFITGDHPITEIPASNPLKKYHVPLILYSPLLKGSADFQEVSGHLDLYESVLSYLQQEHRIDVPPYSTALGFGLRCETTYDDQTTIPLMTDNRVIEDFFYNGLFVGGRNSLYRVKEHFELEEYHDQRNLHKLQKKMDVYQAASVYACTESGLMPDSVFDSFFNHAVIKQFSRNQVFPLGSENFEIFKDLQLDPGTYYLDINISSQNLFDFQAECLIEFKDPFQQNEITGLQESKTGNPNVQFHIPIIISDNHTRGLITEVAIRDRDAMMSLITGIKARIYKAPL